jgi:hypothetical protein
MLGIVGGLFRDLASCPGWPLLLFLHFFLLNPVVAIVLNLVVVVIEVALLS